MAPQLDTTVISSTLSSFTPTITSYEVTEPTAIATTTTVDNAWVKAFKAIPPWSYVFIILDLLLVGNIAFITVLRCWVMGRRFWRERKDAALWKDVEEGRREKLVETFKKLEGKGVQGKENKGSEEEGFWEEIDLNSESGSSSQSKDRETYILEKVKALDSKAHGGISPQELTMPATKLLKE